ncbi:hypothetical protein WR25_08317 [Diploscapter pachys]|uniref:PH domain-containing protein n=1 Tax=Diploscapter pachys TaxID=2018661 RepID=A0A2A2L019_9BILA|nr:hypothetical protein WR25_08317 [Diploscapter pachys]
MFTYRDYIRRRESSEWQLDEILEELSALENQLNSANGDQLLLGMAALPASTSMERIKQPSVISQQPPAQPVQMMQPNGYQNRLPNGTQTMAHHENPRVPLHPSSVASSCSSPDGDSAFCDSSSTESNRCRNSAFSSNDSCRDSLHTPSPTQVSPRNGETQNSEDSKAAKIKLALEKMKEAKMIKMFVKFFVEDGEPLQMLIDERWTVSDTMKQLADKHHIQLMEDHCIVEEFPELYIRRIYEDHEKIVENIQMWVQDSPNKLYFVRRPDKYPFMDRPEIYLVTEKTESIEVPAGDNWTREVKAQFVQDFFHRDSVVPPEMDGFLYLKSDGRKSWKKHYFVLRSSGLYYSPKGKKLSKDLQCLMSLHSNQVYSGINWVKKYKAPTEWCLSIKLTQLQVKRSQYIKYICAEDEPTFRKWIVALRIAKNGSSLLENYEKACAMRREQLSGMSGISASTTCLTPAPTSSSTVSLNGNMRINQNGNSCPASRPISVNTTSCSSSQQDLAFGQNQHKPCIAVQSPSQLSRASIQVDRCHSSTAHLANQEYDEQPTGTIKRAPIDVLRRVSHSSSSNGSSHHSLNAGVEDEDSDEEFPAPPPIMAARTSTPNQQINPIPPPKPAYHPPGQLHQLSNGANGIPNGSPLPMNGMLRPVASPQVPSINGTNGMNGVNGVKPPVAKKAPPPPPKRSDATRLVTAGSSPTPPPAQVPLQQNHMSDLQAALAKRREKIGQI